MIPPPGLAIVRLYILGRIFRAVLLIFSVSVNALQHFHIGQILKPACTFFISYKILQTNKFYRSRFILKYFMLNECIIKVYSIYRRQYIYPVRGIS